MWYWDKASAATFWDPGMWMTCRSVLVFRRMSTVEMRIELYEGNALSNLKMSKVFMLSVAMHSQVA